MKNDCTTHIKLFKPVTLKYPCSSALLSLGPPLPQLSPLALSLPFFLLPVSHFPPGPTLGLSRAGMELRREVVKG